MSFRRRLHGRRGLKYLFRWWYYYCLLSPPSRAAWIEMPCSHKVSSEGFSRRLHGRRGLKLRILDFCIDFGGRRLHGRRGLKSFLRPRRRVDGRSPPSRAAWIEIKHEEQTVIVTASPPSRAAWIEMILTHTSPAQRLSPPSRAAWIEITPQIMRLRVVNVAAFTGGVD